MRAFHTHFDPFLGLFLGQLLISFILDPIFRLMFSYFLSFISIFGLIYFTSILVSMVI